jgi:hypothetical protein
LFETFGTAAPRRAQAAAIGLWYGDEMAPLLRGSVVKQVLDGVDRLSPAESARIRALTSPEVIARIEACTRVDWVPYELHTRLEEAVLEVLGRDRFLAFRSQHTGRLTESPALRSLVSSALSLFGVSPRRLYKLIPRVYDQMCRDAGDVEIVDDGPNGVLVVYSRVPAQLINNACWRLGLLGTFQVMLTMTKHKGTVEVIEHDAATGRVVIQCSWRD